MSTKACSSCGNTNPEDAKFCVTCGTPLSTESHQEEAPRHDAPRHLSDQGAKSGVACPSCGRSDVGEDLFCRWCSQLLSTPNGIANASLLRRLGAYILDAILPFLTLFIGYLIWWLITLQWGQTPGKQLLGIRSMRTDGTSTGWRPTFVREYLVKFIVFNLVLGSLTGGVVYVLDLLWALWDRDRQTLHDKVTSTVVVDDRVYRHAFKPL